MKRILISLAVISTLLITGSVEAQKNKAPSKKLYRWVDSEGKVHFSDSLPPEAIDQARTEMSGTGRVVADVDRAMTAEERAAREKAQAEAARREAEALQTRQSEEAMLASFQTEEDLKRSMNVRVSLLQQTLEAIEAGIASQRASLSALLVQASETELAGGVVKPKQADTIRQLHREIGKQQQMLVIKRTELVDADRNLEDLLRRYRELKSDPAAAAAVPASAVPAETSPADVAPAG